VHHCNRRPLSKVLTHIRSTRNNKPIGVLSNGDVGPKRNVSLTSGMTSPAWPRPDELDVMVAAPGFHAFLFEDDRVRVLDGRASSGATVPVHTHRWGGILYVLGSSDFVRRDPDGNVLADTRASKTRPMAGTAVWCNPLTPHTFQNVGSEEFRTLTVEMKGQGGTTPMERRHR
jgi:hypothetical protein